MGRSKQRNLSVSFGYGCGCHRELAAVVPNRVEVAVGASAGSGEAREDGQRVAGTAGGEEGGEESFLEVFVDLLFVEVDGRIHDDCRWVYCVD